MTENLKSTCCYCGVGCGIVVKKDLHGKLLVEGDKAHPVNKGMLCSKGMNLHYTVMDQQDRLLYPEMRHNKNLPRHRVSWDQALDKTARVFKTLIEKYGPDSVGFYASGQCLTEEYYVVNKLIKGFIGSNNIDTNSRLCMSSAVAAYKMALGEDSVPVGYEDIELADCFFVTGANPAWARRRPGTGWSHAPGALRWTRRGRMPASGDIPLNNPERTACRIETTRRVPAGRLLGS